MLETSLRILSWRTGRAPAEGHPQVGTLQGNVTSSHEERLGVCWEQIDTPAPSPTLGRAVLGEVDSWPQGKAGAVREFQADSPGNERDAPRRGGSEPLT